MVQTDFTTPNWPQNYSRPLMVAQATPSSLEAPDLRQTLVPAEFVVAVARGAGELVRFATSVGDSLSRVQRPRWSCSLGADRRSALVPLPALEASGTTVQVFYGGPDVVVGIFSSLNISLNLYVE